MGRRRGGQSPSPGPQPSALAPSHLPVLSAAFLNPPSLLLPRLWPPPLFSYRNTDGAPSASDGVDPCPFRECELRVQHALRAGGSRVIGAPVCAGRILVAYGRRVGSWPCARATRAAAVAEGVCRGGGGLSPGCESRACACVLTTRVFAFCLLHTVRGCTCVCAVFGVA